MRTYIQRRLLLIIPTLLLVTMLIFALVRMVPGNVIDLMVARMGSDIGGRSNKVTADMIREQMGLDVPIYIQYGRWLGVVPQEDGSFSGVVQGNLGESLWTQRPIAQDLVQRLPVTLELGFFAFLTALIIAIPIGVYSAMRQDTIGDYVGRTFAVVAISFPSFWLGTMVVVYPTIWWHWTPSLEYIPFFQDPMGNLVQFIVPGAILGMILNGSTMRMTRTMMLEVLRQDYIRTAWSKGLSERTVILRHAMKNALIPVVTVVGMHVPVLIGGSVVLEQIFALPGVGRYMLEAINTRDYSIISGVNVVVATFVVFANLAVDLTYGYLDPRVHYK